MTVKQYDQEFNILSLFAPELVGIEDARAERFVRGLRKDLQDFVRVFKPATQAVAVHLVVDLGAHEADALPRTLENGASLG
ncbi:gag-protease polyprotein [Cucumis melo var. makuwa]|uniref:Gag-protease polyprotein n=1 Tax=Cucumis melo var. makuwa TaxID=1194695 RepID=A0A5A7TM36_CUCMM|nr:gag-protease polyprotein [Cucumis melo var. makuwa]TYK22879.1 gag-protease polyprotein [Cucumis melo var. makuwa]